MTELFRFQIPATIAHLGPGFGVLGIAVDRFLSVTVHQEKGHGHRLERRGAAEPLMDQRHEPLLRAFQRVVASFELKTPPCLRFAVESQIPIAAGLGSNTAAYAAGAAAAVHFARQRPEPDALLGHLVQLGADQAHAPAALLGGLASATLVSRPNEPVSFRALHHPIDPRWRFAVAVPRVHIGTADNRRIIPPTLPHAAVWRTSGRLVALLRALASADEELLKIAIYDEVHVPYRRTLVPGLEQALDAALAAGAAGATIAGHGPGLVALTTHPAAVAGIEAAMQEELRSRGFEVESLVLQSAAAGGLSR